ncbi:MAG: L-seryl-tRNA(Sec) selenium transferase, partial [Acidobacteriota bacterium]|nr:L-seryl-tRNA(Sec) selenium transferase [Acidobacteriota bacterium]
MSKSRIIPSIEQLLQRSGVQVLLQTYGRTATVNALRAAAEKLRTELEGPSSSNRVRVEVLEAAEHLESEAEMHLTRSFKSSLQPVINATGVIIHTNLGRAPLADSAVKAIATIAPHFTNLEYDVESGG